MTRPRRILAVASGGGHWIQLSRLAPAWKGMNLTYVTTAPVLLESLSHDADILGQAVPPVYYVPDANRWQKRRFVLLLAKLLWIMIRVRPDVVVTTGAAPGYLALRVGRLMGARTIWIDSIANAAELSLSGRLARQRADICLSQWPEVAEAEGVRFEGAVI